MMATAAPRVRRRVLPLTKEGWWFLTAAALVAGAAWDAGVNLFFFVFGTMVSLLAAGAALAGMTLSGLRVRRMLPPAAHVGTPYLVGIALENGKRRLPSFSVEVEDLVAGEPIDKRCYFLKLPAGRTQETAYRQIAPRRGRYRLSGFRLSTKFPFGLLQRTRLVEDEQDFIVYPALIAPGTELLRGLPIGGLSSSRQRALSRSGEFLGLRAFRPGDDPRDIHWRTSARRGAWLVREHEDAEGRLASIVLDNVFHPSAGDPERHVAAFERAVSEAAGVCFELVRRGFTVELVMRGGCVRAEGGRGHTDGYEHGRGEQIDRILQALALVEPSAASLGAPSRAAATVWIRPGQPARVAGPPRASAVASRT